MPVFITYHFFPTSFYLSACVTVVLHHFDLMIGFAYAQRLYSIVLREA